MQYHWLNKKNNKSLIIFFAGWSFDYIPFEFLDCKNNDVLVVYDYNDITYNLPNFDEYSEKYLISWSMGVYIAYLLKDKLPKFDKAIAVNGTIYPVDDILGIPQKTFELTLKFAETGLQGKFYKNVFNNDDFCEKYFEKPVERRIENRVSELISLQYLIKNTNIHYDGEYYDEAIVSLSDKIIPTKNQLVFWGSKAKTIDCGHFPFYNYSCWEDICN